MLPPPLLQVLRRRAVAPPRRVRPSLHSSRTSSWSRWLRRGGGWVRKVVVEEVAGRVAEEKWWVGG